MGRKKILIVDDNDEIRLGLSVRLRANNYETFFAADAMTAIAVARKEMPELVILDIGLPGGSGYMIMKRMKMMLSLSTIPIIVMSGQDPHIHKEASLKYGAVAFFHKPFDDKELLTTIRETLGESVGPEKV